MESLLDVVSQNEALRASLATVQALNTSLLHARVACAAHGSSMSQEEFEALVRIMSEDQDEELVALLDAAEAIAESPCD